MSLFCRNIFPKHALSRQRACLGVYRSFYSHAKPRTRSTDVRWFIVSGGLGLGMATASFGSTLHCDPSSTPPASRPTSPAPLQVPKDTPPPESILNLYELSFGTVAGICAGVFVKKGAKVIACVVGGVFVLLQYFNSLTLIRVDWGQVSKRFEDLFYTVDANGVKKPPTVGSLWRWLVNFLAADFQPRASFVTGLLLGFRLG